MAKVRYPRSDIAVSTRHDRRMSAPMRTSFAVSSTTPLERVIGTARRASDFIEFVERAGVSAITVSLNASTRHQRGV